jgi:large subunit ribosomal protein L21
MTTENSSSTDSEQTTQSTQGPLAIVRTSGRQFFLSEGMEFEVNRIEGEVGSKLNLDEVLLYTKEGSTKVGTPLLSDVKVEVSIVSHKRGPKLISFKKIRRRGKEWKKGHRQDLTRLKVTSIA